MSDHEKHLLGRASAGNNDFQYGVLANQSLAPRLRGYVAYVCRNLGATMILRGQCVQDSQISIMLSESLADANDL